MISKCFGQRYKCFWGLNLPLSNGLSAVLCSDRLPIDKETLTYMLLGAFKKENDVANHKWSLFAVKVALIQSFFFLQWLPCWSSTDIFVSKATADWVNLAQKVPSPCWVAVSCCPSGCQAALSELDPFWGRSDGVWHNMHSLLGWKALPRQKANICVLSSQQVVILRAAKPDPGKYQGSLNLSLKLLPICH